MESEFNTIKSASEIVFQYSKKTTSICIFKMQIASVNYFVFHVILEIKNIEAFTIRQNEKGKILKGKITTFEYIFNKIYMQGEVLMFFLLLFL